MNRIPGIYKQRGAALFMALIMLLILTVLSLSSMRGATMQSKLSGNHQHKQLSFQVAENLLQTLMSMSVAEAITANCLPNASDSSTPVVNCFAPPGTVGNIGMTAADTSLTTTYIQKMESVIISGEMIEFGSTDIFQYEANAIATTASNSQSHSRLGFVRIVPH